MTKTRSIRIREKGYLMLKKYAAKNRRSITETLDIILEMVIKE